MKTLPKTSLRTQLTSACSSNSKVHEDPRQALLLAAQLPPGASSREQGQLFSSWATDDPQAATAAAFELPRGPKRDEALGNVATMWVEKDPAAALEFFAKQGDKGAYERALEQAVSSAGADHPDMIAGYLDTMPGGAKRDELIESFAMRWGGEDLPNAKAWAMSLREDTERDKALLGLIQGHEDGTLDLVNEIQDPKIRSTAAYAIASQLASSDPEAALRFALEQPKSAEHEGMIANVIDSWAGEDPRAAADALAHMKDPPERALIGVARNWVNVDPKAALRWAEDLPAGDARTTVLSQLSSSWAEHDPQAAAEYADRENNKDAVVEPARTWATNDPLAALNWLDSRHSKVGRDEAVDATISYWAAVDQRRALEWTNNQPAGETKDRALRRIGEEMAYQEPAKAVYVVMGMRPGDERAQQLLNVYDSWHASDSEAAAAWLATVHLPPKELDAIKNPEGDGGVKSVPQAETNCVCPPTSD